MSEFLQALTSGRVLLMDGAMGTELQKAGVQTGECFEEWNLAHPDQVRAVHQAYADAGAEVLLTNTFQVRNASKASAAPLAGAACSALAIARSVHGVRWVLGDIGPMPDQPKGDSFPRPEPLLQLADWLTGVDAIFLETCSDWSAWKAVDWLSDAMADQSVPILLSLAFHFDKEGRIRSRDGHEPEEFAHEASGHNIAALGVNCGVDQDMALVTATIRRMRQATDVPLFARPNAGTPIQAGGRWIYPHSPAQMADGLPDLLEAGACMIGGCCGTTPAHIAAFRQALTK